VEALGNCPVCPPPLNPALVGWANVGLCRASSYNVAFRACDGVARRT